ncbi:RNA-directed DNA polymerase, eukaryota, reverse transcriptase zinc-binding domain protein [Tanacetum coccineum]
MMSPPLEAWSSVGLSVFASRIGTPLIMDAMTTRMCNQRIGSLGYDKVLVEVNADKGLEDHIDVLYKRKDNDEQFAKKIRVEYDWKLPLCSHCKVFGHSDNKCPRLTKPEEQGQDKKKDNEVAVDDEEKLLRQKAKVTWLKEGDKNSTYFHKVLKGRQNRSRIMSICAEDGKRYDNCDVADQFVNHFTGFLGISPSVSKLTEEENEEGLFDIDDNKALARTDSLPNFIKNPRRLSKVSDYRPIACCNVVYKCISKILTNRIKSALNQIFANNQSVFMPGRVITDNILLTQELLKGYNCINGPKRVSFKIDIQKIMTCIATLKFTICVNGERHRHFKKGRGLRQGGPISPYIVTMGFNPIFGENCTIFLGEVLDGETKSDISSIFPFKEGKLPVRYLGVPLVTKKIGVADCKQLVDKVNQKLNDWKNKSLSCVGRAQLIALVLSSTQVYWASVFLLPKTVIKEIEKMFKKFLWNSGDSCKGKANMA